MPSCADGGDRTQERLTSELERVAGSAPLQGVGVCTSPVLTMRETGKVVPTLYLQQVPAGDSGWPGRNARGRFSANSRRRRGGK